MANGVEAVDLVSVIIPVYNVKPYLPDALDSVIHQSYPNLEILVVDDGSTDGSGEICDEYAARDPRVRVIHQKNGGLSAARNAGLDAMTGQALVFLDSDDAFHPDMVRTLTETMKREQADLVLGRFTDHVTTGTMDPETTGSLPAVPAGTSGRYSRVQALRALADVQINVSVWNKLYRRALWEGIRFPDGHVFEDLDTTYRVFDRLDRLYLTEQKVYLHRIAPGSITAGWSERKVRDWLLAYSHYEAFMFSHIPDIFSEEQLFSARQIRLNAMLDAYSRLAGNTKEEKAFRKTLRGWLLEFADKAVRKRCRFPTRAACCLLRFCPWALRLAFPVFSRLRR